MFDKDNSGTIDLHEFQALWHYIQQWKQTFDKYDTNRSGSIEAMELQQGWYRHAIEGIDSIFPFPTN